MGFLSRKTFQSVHCKFLDVFDHLQSHLDTVKVTKTVDSSTLIGQDHFHRSILSGLWR